VNYNHLITIKYMKNDTLVALATVLFTGLIATAVLVVACGEGVAHAEEIDLGEITMEQMDIIYAESHVPYVETWEEDVRGTVQTVLTEYMSELGVTEEQLDLDDYQILDATVFAELGYDWDDLNEE
jgi:hypothetical protein